MRQFLYFLPDVDRDLLKALIDRGLADRFINSRTREIGQHARTHATGPEGAQGLLIGRSSDGLRYAPDAQQWSGRFGADDAPFWIGHDLSDKPGPADLAREEIELGTAVRLADGNEWTIPVWRFSPTVITMSPDRVLKHEPLETRKRLEAHMLRMREVFAADTDAEMDDEELLSRAADILSINYRVSPDPVQEVSILKLITPANFVQIVNAVLDVAFFREIVETAGAGSKKNE